MSSGSTQAFNNPGVRDALWMSVKAGLGATAIAIVLGTLASYAVARFEFFGRNTISFLVVLPIALPGIVTGMALNATFTQVLGVDLALWTIIVGHATFCIVVVFNNVVARLRRTSASLEEAGGDLGATSLRGLHRHHLPADALGADRGRAAGLRAELRRGDRHDVHGRRRPDAADLDPQQPLAPAQPPDRQRRRGDRRDPLGDPRVPGAAPLGRPDRGRGDGARHPGGAVGPGN